MTLTITINNVTREMTPEEEDAFLAAQPGNQAVMTPSEISDRQFFQQLAVMGLITEEESEEAASAGILPPAITALIDELPAQERYPTRMKLRAATTFLRSDPLVETFGEMQGMTPEQIDDLWRAAAAL